VERKGLMGRRSKEVYRGCECVVQHGTVQQLFRSTVTEGDEIVSEKRPCEERRDRRRKKMTGEAAQAKTALEQEYGIRMDRKASF
jgi:hypothetical protein